MACIEINIEKLKANPDVNISDISDKLKTNVEKLKSNSTINLSDISDKLIVNTKTINDVYNVKISDISDKLKVYCSLICDINEKPIIEISFEDIELDYSGNSVIVNVKSNTDWTVEYEPWNNNENLSITYEGNGDGYIKIASDIAEGLDRKTTIRLVDKNKEIVVYKEIKQKGMREIFSNDFIPLGGGTFNVLKNEL